MVELGATLSGDLSPPLLVLVSGAMAKVRRILHNLREDLKDRLDRRPPPTSEEPRPRDYVPAIGKGEFDSIGRDFVRYFVEHADLKPSDRILDVGCGLGRMVAPLQGVLNETGSYEGFDIVRELIRWDKRHLTHQDARFKFQHVDVFNSSYNPGGHIKPESFRFPFPDAEFDFVFATSVFTHLMGASTRQYLAQCARVLRPGGRLFVTFFLFDETTQQLIDDGISDIGFHQPWELGFLMNPEKPEDAVAYHSQWVFDYLGALGLEVRLPPRYGGWSGRKDTLDYQDILIADKR